MKLQRNLVLFNVNTKSVMKYWSDLWESTFVAMSTVICKAWSDTPFVSSDVGIRTDTKPAKAYPLPAEVFGGVEAVHLLDALPEIP